LSHKYQELLKLRSSDEKIFLSKVDELNNVINDKQFEIEQLRNDINAKNVQLDKQESRINYFMSEVDKQKEAREQDRIRFEEDIKRINHENDEFRKTI
jgi:acetyl-CoA carboxylase alpha subunit